MKKQYIAPSVKTRVFQGMTPIMVVSEPAKITGESTPIGEFLDNVNSDNGDVWNDAASKSFNMWE